MNPETNRFEKLRPDEQGFPDEPDATRDLSDVMKDLHRIGANSAKRLLRPDGTPVPEHWAVLAVGEKVVIKNYTFEVKYIGETSLLLEPVGVVPIGNGEKAG